MILGSSGRAFHIILQEQVPSFLRDRSLDINSVAVHNFIIPWKQSPCFTLSRRERHDVKASVLDNTKNPNFFPLPYKILHQLEFSGKLLKLRSSNSTILLRDLSVPVLYPYLLSSTIVSLWHASPPKLLSNIIRRMRLAGSLSDNRARSIRRRWEATLSDSVLHWGTMLLNFDRESYTQFTQPQVIFAKSLVALISQAKKPSSFSAR